MIIGNEIVSVAKIIGKEINPHLHRPHLHQAPNPHEMLRVGS